MASQTVELLCLVMEAKVNGMQWMLVGNDSLRHEPLLTTPIEG
jgi:hypothetical protein